MINQVLQQIGLTAKEAQIYQLMLKFGETPIADLIRETGDHPQIIYRAVDGLVAKDLATSFTKLHRKYVRAESPQKLADFEEKRLKEVNQIIPTLSALQKIPKEVSVKVSKGPEAVRSFRFKALEQTVDGDVYYVIGASGDRYYEVMAEQMIEWENKRVKKGIVKKLITFENERTKLVNLESQQRLAEFRFLPESYPVPVSINIAKNQSALLIWNPEPIAIVIESPEIAENYLNYFQILWKIAKT